jgi:hypothetical protein
LIVPLDARIPPLAAMHAPPVNRRRTASPTARIFIMITDAYF